MKKYSLVLLIIVVFFISPTKSNAQVSWDGAEVVKGQTGKMTFSKDVKVYKKNSNGTYNSMTVKRNNFFRVYNIEKYDQKTFYWMSSGYRVQATDLVIFKEVPTEIRSSFYNNPAYIVSNRQGTKAYFEEKYPIIDLAYGQHLLNEHVPGNYSAEVYFDKGKLNYFYSLEEGNEVNGVVDGTDIRIVETTTRDKGYYAVTTDTQLLMGPMNGARAIEWNPPSTLNDVNSLNKFVYPKGSAFQSLGMEVNGYLRVQSITGERGYMPANLLEPVNNQGKRYIRYGVVAKGIDDSQQLELKRFDEVSFYTENEYIALIAVNGKMYTVPKNVIAIKMPNESPVIISFLPNERLQKLEYQNIAGNRVYKRTANNHFTAEDSYYITYHETDQAFNFDMNGVKYSFAKPLKEGAIITRLSGTTQDQGYVRAIHYSLTTPAGTFENVVETSFDQFFAPGYGLLANTSDRLISF